MSHSFRSFGERRTGWSRRCTLPRRVADATAEIIGSDKFMLYDDYYELFKEDGQLSNENLFENYFLIKC